jgi:hypothetical protein
MSTLRAYGAVVELVESIGGKMEFEAGGGPGGVWRIDLYGKTARVAARDRKVNALDHLYEGSEGCERWDDFPEDTKLRDDAFFRLVDLVRLHAAE